MCISVVRKVIRTTDNTADLEDGRTVRLGLVGNIHPGDYLEVYGDIAIAKVQKADVAEYNSIQK